MLGNQTPLAVAAEAAVADAVQGYHETARGDGLERGQIEALLHTGQADRDSALGQQGEEGALVDELRDQQVLEPYRRTYSR